MKKKTIIFSVGGLLIVVLAALFGPLLSPYSYETVSDVQFASPSFSHWLGTDIHGRDLLTRILYGARISLLVGFIGAGVSLVIGVVYGIVSGYCGGKIDAFMMRVVDILYSLPRIIIVIACIALLDEAAKNWLHNHQFKYLIQSSRIIILFVAIGMIEWLTMARIVRGQVLVLRERAFIHASQALGQSAWRIMFQHLLPNLSGVILVYLTLTIPAVILEESFLSFLGLGVQAPQASWGTQLADGATFINPLKTYWWLLLAPASFMAFTLLCLNFLGDSLRDLFDPRSL
ncbi:MAG: ABC transporter permease [Verrucomicrobiota bacterium]